MAGLLGDVTVYHLSHEISYSETTYIINRIWNNSVQVAKSSGSAFSPLKAKEDAIRIDISQTIIILKIRILPPKR